MTTLLVCTGKKKAVEKMQKFFQEEEEKKRVTILASAQQTKKAMIWAYEELKLLFDTKGPAKIQIEQKLTKNLDFYQFRQPRGIVVKMITFSTEKSDLKWNIISRTTTFQLRGGRVDIQEEVEERARREYRKCYITLAGPPESVVNLKDILVKQRVVDPKTVEYIL